MMQIKTGWQIKKMVANFLCVDRNAKENAVENEGKW